jgi:uncharacterized protein
MYRLSRFAFSFEKNDVVALYHSLKMNTIYIEQGLYHRTIEALRNPNADYDYDISTTITALRKAEMVVDRDSQEELTLHKIANSLTGKVNISMLYLLLTDSCNLRCSYCFLDSNTASNFRGTQMSKETVKEALDFFVTMKSNYSDHSNAGFVHLYGGEPLDNKIGCLTAIEYVADMKNRGKLPDNLKTIVVTNGTLINKDIAKFFKKYQVNVGISIDGPKTITNAYRKSSTGKGAYDRAIHGYSLLAEAGVPLGVSCTVVPELLDRKDELLDFLSSLPHCQGISLNILLNNLGIKLNADYYRRAADFTINIFESLRDMGLYEERMIRKLSSYIQRSIMPYDCGVGGQQIAIGPSGKVSVCQDSLRNDEYVMANIGDTDFNPNKSPIMNEWNRRSPLNMPQCLSCSGLGICGGGCGINAKLLHGSIWDLDDRFCIHCTQTLQWLIWDEYAHTKKAE